MTGIRYAQELDSVFESWLTISGILSQAVASLRRVPEIRISLSMPADLTETVLS